MRSDGKYDQSHGENGNASIVLKEVLIDLCQAVFMNDEVASDGSNGNSNYRARVRVAGSDERPGI